MRGPESNLWDRVRGKMVGLWDADRVESSTCKGFPDVVWSSSGVSGLIELKVIKNINHTKPLVIPHLTAEQSNWMATKSKRGDGRADLLLYVQTQDSYILIPAFLVPVVFDRKMEIHTLPQPMSKYAPRRKGLDGRWLLDRITDDRRYRMPPEHHLATPNGTVIL